MSLLARKDRRRLICRALVTVIDTYFDCSERHKIESSRVFAAQNKVLEVDLTVTAMYLLTQKRYKKLKIPC